MIAFLRGKLASKTPTDAVIETGGVGFRLRIPLSSYRALGELGQETHLWTHLHAREDALQLFGFATHEERNVFELLISVSGIGPSSAQSILSGISVEDFKKAIRSQDISRLTKAPGIGKKTAERLILELKEKIILSTGDSVVSKVFSSPVEEEAVLALVSLGYKQTKAETVTKKILEHDQKLPVEEIVRRALQSI